MLTRAGWSPENAKPALPDYTFSKELAESLDLLVAMTLHIGVVTTTRPSGYISFHAPETWHVLSMTVL